MIENIISLILFLLGITIYSIIWGKAMTFLPNSKHLTNLARFIMRYSTSKLDPIKFYLLWASYLITSLVGSVVLSIVFQINLLDFFAIKTEYIKYIFVGFVAQMSLSSLILMMIASINTKIDWFAQIFSVPWVKMMGYLPSYIRPLYPISGAFFEEMFFRGFVFIVLLKYFPSVGVLIPIAVSTLLFILQQVLNTNTKMQGLGMAIGAATISIVGCLLILLTGSFLPALLCHEFYVFFYIGGFDSSHSQPKGTSIPQNASF